MREPSARSSTATLLTGRSDGVQGRRLDGPCNGVAQCGSGADVLPRRSLELNVTGEPSEQSILPSGAIDRAHDRGAFERTPGEVDPEPGSGLTLAGPAPLVFVVALGISSIGVLFLVFFVFIVIRSRTIFDVPQSPPGLLWVSSAILVGSSGVLEAARSAARRLDGTRCARLLAIATGLGAAFVVAQAVVWWQLHDRGFYAPEQIRAGLLYLMTTTHAVHVAGGLAGFGFLLRRRPSRRSSIEALEEYASWLAVGAVYWHAMGAVWVLIFGVLLWQGI
jgi:cytochrome c oxidase subunit 3